MTNPTSNFNWQMPTPTDLVTDLPADFEVFGQAVDTSMADLLGGTTGQILAKASNSNMDFAWITNDVGDITAVNVTSPITGGGSSGAVTIGINAATTSVVGAVQLSDSTSTTSSVLASTPTATKAAYDLADAAIAKSVVTTAGDIIYRNATVPVRLGIGTANQVLRVNSGATAPEWATAASGGMTLLSTTTLSGATTNITSIDQTYNQLYVLVTGASVNATAGAYPSIKPNGSGSICSVLYLFGTGGTVNSQAAAAGNINFHYNNWVLNNTNNAAVFIFDNYASTTNYKPWAGHGQYINNSSATESFNGAGNVLTNTAITSLLFGADTSSFNGGTVKVYGVK
jgi:hypothetical protein